MSLQIVGHKKTVVSNWETLWFSNSLSLPNHLLPCYEDKSSLYSSPHWEVTNNHMSELIADLLRPASSYVAEPGSGLLASAQPSDETAALDDSLSATSRETSSQRPTANPLPDS